MTNKQHTKFHISYIKDHACRHKSMAAMQLANLNNMPDNFYNAV